MLYHSTVINLCLNVFTSYLIWARHCRNNLFVPVSGPHPTFGLAESRPDLELQQSGRLWFFFYLFFTVFRFWFFPFFFYCLPRRYEWSEEGWMWPFHGWMGSACFMSRLPRLRFSRPPMSCLSGIYARTARSRFVCTTLASAASETEGAQGRFALRRESVWHRRVLGRRRRRSSENYLGPHCPKTGRGRGQCGIAATTDRWKWSLPAAEGVAGWEQKHFSTAVEGFIGLLSVSTDSVVGQDEAVMPECRSRPRSRHGRSTGDRRSSVDRRATGRPAVDRRCGRPAVRSTGGRSPESRSTGARSPSVRSSPGRSATSQLSPGRPVTALRIRSGMFHVLDRWRTGSVGVTHLNRCQTSWANVCCKR